MCKQKFSYKCSSFFKLAENMMEELTIVAKDVEGALTDVTITGPPGTGNSRFSVQTGEDFQDCDILGGMW